jgi:hypothetical protein
MSKLKQSTATFERFALTATLREHPGDETAAKALVDHLEEAGYTNMGARREVARIVREQTAIAQCDRVNRLLTMSRSFAAAARAAVLDVRKGTHGGEWSLEAVPGGMPPCWSPVSGQYRDDAGNVLMSSPHTYTGPHGYRWVPTIWAVKVGAAWLALRCPHATGDVATAAKG